MYLFSFLSLTFAKDCSCFSFSLLATVYERVLLNEKDAIYDMKKFNKTWLNAY